ncbi:SH2 domain-containing protein 2A-like [Chanos chanos]|uniref:SH2 domain-containing protein 2A-like n=1 Tax=Chanos chanos TaxID=29144 RepID=A0A6J2UV26_CHACN|nr:SH2 domain-containing protein 2A-like [Chanos chanos]
MKKRQDVEQENKSEEKDFHGPVPMPRTKKPQPRPRSMLTGVAKTGVAKTGPGLAPVPRPRSKQFEATPFDNEPIDLSVLVGQPSSDEERVKEKHQKRSNTLRWFKDTQARKVVENGTFPCWFHGMITRRQAEDLIKDKPLGCFLIRVGQSREGYTLTYRGANRSRHYMIEMQSNGKYVILGEDRAHSSLPDLVQYHTRVGIKPFMELLTVPCGQTCEHEPDYEELRGMMLGNSSLEPGQDVKEEPRSGADHVHLEFQRLFQPPGQSQQSSPDSHKPPVMKRIYDRRRRMEERVEHEEPGHKSKAVPRLYPSIRLAMREIQQIQQQFSEGQEQAPPLPQRPWTNRK